MLIESPLENLIESSDAPAEIDWLDLTWAQCLMRALKKCSRGGREVRILLKPGVALKHNDLIWRDRDAAIAIHVLECECLLIRRLDEAESAKIAFTLGDLHVPIQLAGSLIITPLDGPTEASLVQLGATYSIERRRFEPSLKSASTINMSDSFELTRT